jgi:putative acetyltransferase
VLSTELVLLRPWREADLPALCALRNDVALQRELMARARGSSLSATRAWLERRTADPLDVLLIVASPADEATVRGFIQLSGGDATLRMAMLGICVLPPWQGAGVAADALSLLADHARHVLGLRKLALEVLADNGRAVAFYRRHGFQEVGVRRRHFPWAGEWLDVTVMERFLSA